MPDPWKWPILEDKRSLTNWAPLHEPHPERLATCEGVNFLRLSVSRCVLRAQRFSCSHSKSAQCELQKKPGAQLLPRSMRFKRAPHLRMGPLPPALRILPVVL